MNAAEKAKLQYLMDIPQMEIEAELAALVKASDYSDEFNAKCSDREIRRAGERAHWVNVMIPLFKAAKRKEVSHEKPMD